VASQLARHWAQAPGFRLTVVGSGPRPPAAGVHYLPLPWRVPGQDGRPTELSVRGYARFSRQFEQRATELLEELARRQDPSNTCIVHNDICEAADFARVHELGFRQVAIFHVDVVDYTARVYLRGKCSGAALARAYRRLEALGVHRWLPEVAKLILKKQQDCARHCDLLVVPSQEMALRLRRAYPWLDADRVLVTPWGVAGEAPSPGVAAQVAAIREEYGLDNRGPVLLTLSRISPEKGQDILLGALRLWERRGGEPLTLFICGAPAFMHGQAYFAKLQRLARRLRRSRVFFVGHVGGARKAAFFEIADLYVFPSRHESYGLTLVEAMAAGLPVLTTPHLSARELVRPQWGRVRPPTPEGIYQGLVELLSLGEELAQMGARARRFARQLEFSQAADRLAQAIRRLFQDPRPPEPG